MTVTTTPNVDDAVRMDPVLAIAIEAMRKDKGRTGYLHLYRSNRRGPFDAIYYRDGERFAFSSMDLVAAILGAVEKPQATA